MHAAAEVDAKRIVLWGTSLSGGHVLATAAADPAIAAVIAQCPALDGTEAAEEMVHRQGLGAINWV
ncbi:MAG: acetylxylan esterase [Caldilineaceae bacterium]